MIDVKELRIGDYICDDEGCLAKVVGLKPHDHLVRCDHDEGCQIIVDCYYASGSIVSGCVAESDQCDPIPLTSEWLYKLGFDKKIDSDREEYWVNNYVELYWYEFHDPADNAFYHITNSPNETVIEYVHQLQNLYFALTNSKELELKNN